MKVGRDAGIFGEARIVADEPQLQAPAGAVEREPDGGDGDQREDQAEIDAR